MHKATEPGTDPVDNVRLALTAAGARDTVHVFKDKVPTAAAAAAVLGCEVAAITNSLIFDLDGQPLLILASGAAKVDTALVAEQLGTGRIRRAKPAFVLEHTGQEVGGVAPVGHPGKSERFWTRRWNSTPSCGQAPGTITRCSPSATKSWPVSQARNP